MRFADDVVRGGELETDARRIMAVLPKRCARCGLRMPPTQTARIACRKPEARQETEDGNGPCDFLGLTHDWTPSRRGCWVITRTTARKRRPRTKKSLGRWCRTNRHAPLTDQYQMRCRTLRGPFQYDGMRGHFRLVEGIAPYAEKAWRSGLSRRSSKSGSGWEHFQKLLRISPLPIPRIVHNI
jgi:RNA-directed DNA polymerase